MASVAGAASPSAQNPPQDVALEELRARLGGVSRAAQQLQSAQRALLAHNSAVAHAADASTQALAALATASLGAGTESAAAGPSSMEH